MATYGKAGAGIRKMWAKLFLASLGVMLALWGASQVLLRNAVTLPPLVWLGGFAVVLLLMRMTMDRLEHRAGQMERGLRAETAVEDVLAKLGQEYVVVHDLVIGHGNIDHVVIGPGGIFTIETKSHRGKVTSADDKLLLNGRPPEKDFLSQSYAEAMAVKEYLAGVSDGTNYYVQPLLVFTAAFVQIRGPVRGVRVLPSKWLVETISSGTAKLGAEECTKVGGALRMMATVPDEAEPTPAVLREPSRLERVVRDLAARALALVAVVGLLWWIGFGGGGEWLARYLLSGFADNAHSSSAPEAEAAGNGANVNLAKQYLAQYAAEQYPRVANLDNPEVTTAAGDSTDYTWEWVDTSKPSAATVRTVTIRVGPSGEWAGLSFGP